MRVTKPNQMTSGISKYEEALSKFEEQFANEDTDLDYYHLVIVGEYNRETCDEIQQTYINAGWSRAKCSTSSEKGERGGLTGLVLYR